MSLLYQKALRRLPDNAYIRMYYFKNKRELLHLKDPKKFTQKIQWLKLHGNLERFAEYADKYTVRPYIEKTVGKEYLVPLIGMWENFDDIPFDTLPDRFVLKATHGCNYNFICKDKSKIDMPKLRTMVNQWMSENFYEQERETQYKDCKPRIICETYLEDETGGLRDYKIWCSKGKPVLAQVDSDRFTNHTSDIFDIKWNKVDRLSATTFGLVTKPIKKPKNLPEMLRVATKLSQTFPFVRVDLYMVNDKIYVGELTFTPGSGMVTFDTVEADIELGNFIDLAAYADLAETTAQ